MMLAIFDINKIKIIYVHLTVFKTPREISRLDDCYWSNRDRITFFRKQPSSIFGDSRTVRAKATTWYVV